ncbi:MAG TPA: hypothetical protein VF548_02370 [Allosphingosinicella sp.]|jgi:ribosomal protein L34E
MDLDCIPGSGEWEPWTPVEVADRLAACSTLWGIAGGWALDIWRERQSRPHGDIEIAVSSAGLGAVAQCLQGHVFYAASQGRLAEVRPGESGSAHQFWLLDPVARKWRLDVMTDPGDEARWIYRRDHRVTVPREEILGRSMDGVPYLRPQAVLLFKAKDPRPKDEFDFAGSVPKLASGERRWLTDALSLAHPQSPWIDILSPNGTN